MDSKILAKITEVYERINAEKEAKKLAKKIKDAASRAEKGNYVVFKTENNKLGVVIPSNIGINALNRFTIKNSEAINEFKNSNNKTLKL